MGNVLESWYRGYGVIDSLRAATIRQKQGGHTLAFLDYQFSRSNYTSPKEGTPLALRWGTTPNAVADLFGYVNHVKTMTGHNGIPYTRVYVLGTSRPMNSTVPTVWTHTTRSAIVRDIARRYRLRSVIHPHNYIVETWASGQDSDFSALRRLADEAGYALWVDGATLFFLDPERVVSSARRNQTPTFNAKQVREGDFVSGAAAPRGSGTSKRRVVYGLDYTSNEFFEVRSGSTENPTQTLNKTALTYDEALSMTEASERQNQDYNTAKVLLIGDARLRPTSLFALLEGGAVPYEHQGSWMIQEVEHVINEKEFTSLVRGVRNADGVPTVRSPSVLRNAPEIGTAVLRSGRLWEAERQEHINV